MRPSTRSAAWIFSRFDRNVVQAPPDADEPMDVDDRRGPVDLELAGGELLGVGGLTLLWVGLADPLGDRCAQRLHEQLRCRP